MEILHGETTPQRSYNNKVLETIRAHHPLLPSSVYLFLKRVFDLAITLITLPVWMPLLGLCALLIKLDSPEGPAFFTQMRTGKGGRRFKMHKFRTMVEDAEGLKADFAHLNELRWPDFKIKNDPRITRVGSVLRKVSIDELPQLINVLKGEMSLVGPRPTSFTPDTYRLWQTERLDVMPGITGLWQLVRHGGTEFDDRLRLDILYIDQRSLFVDFYILVHTIVKIIKYPDAH
jgi:lipopolysaccharide/colanic/teichoic acid biosynthesis glycosyltransferase